jgi:hypothetical protein
MQYASLQFHGDTDKALSLAASALTAVGFRITEQTVQTVKLIVEKVPWSVRRTFGLPKGKVNSLDAELGGVARMARFLILFPIGLTVGLGVVLSLVFVAICGVAGWIIALGAAVGGNTVLWLLLGPLMARKIRARTQQALDALLAIMVSVGESM